MKEIQAVNAAAETRYGARSLSHAPLPVWAVATVVVTVVVVVGAMALGVVASTVLATEVSLLLAVAHLSHNSAELVAVAQGVATVASDDTWAIGVAELCDSVDVSLARGRSSGCCRSNRSRSGIRSLRRSRNVGRRRGDAIDERLVRAGAGSGDERGQ